MRWNKYTAICLAMPVVQCLSLHAQMPETDLWLFKLEKKESAWIYKNGMNITNRAGYDNQPAFTPDNKSILYVSVCEDNQADIYKYDIAHHQSSRLVSSPESEYSPVVTPDGKGITCVVVEADSAQRIWLYGTDGQFKKILSEATDSVGYYTWLNADSLLYYKLTEPHSLRALSLKSGKDVFISEKPVRAFKAIPGQHDFLYGLKDSTGVSYYMYNPSLRKSRFYARSQSTAEDFVWNPVWGLVRSEKGTLLRYNEKTMAWDLLFNFEPLGIHKITRFTFDAENKQLVIASNL